VSVWACPQFPRSQQDSSPQRRVSFFAYALAKSTGEPLLFKGDEFAHTDIKPAGAER
jgi:hypothetical protein